MKATVQDGCIGCGLCVSTCPEVFSMDGIVAVAAPGEVPPEAQDAAERACGNCPVNVIVLQDN